MSPTPDPNHAVVPCPADRHPIEVLFLGEDNMPLPGILVELQKSPEVTLLRRTAGDGIARFDGLPAGSYRAAFPELDRDAWKLVRQEPIPDESSGDADWGSPAPRPNTETTHTVLPGDCLSNIGFDYGFAPTTVWEYGPNAGLRGLRSSPHVLLPGDSVAIPALRERAQSVNTAIRLVLIRIGVPEILRIRFVTHGLKPRADLPYLLEIETAGSEPVDSREGTTDADGYIIQPIPPNATTGRILLGSGVDIEEYPIRLGHIDPLTSLSGVQGRLENLGYDCGDGNGEANEATRSALELFQREHDLPVTGEPDTATQAKLESMHLS